MIDIKKALKMEPPAIRKISGARFVTTHQNDEGELDYISIPDDMSDMTAAEIIKSIVDKYGVPHLYRLQ